MGGRIIVRQTNWIGDAVMTMPALELLRKAHQEDQIWIAARPWVAPVFEALPWLKGTIPLLQARGLEKVSLLAEQASSIRKGRFDLGVVFPNSFESALLFFLARIPQRAGYASDMRRLLLTRPFPVPDDKKRRHEVFYYLNLVSRLTGMPVPERPRIRLAVARKGRQGADRILAETGLSSGAPLVGFNPGAAYGPAKCWPEERWVELGKALCRRFQGCRIAILGTDRERESFAFMAEEIGSGAVSLAGRTSLSEAMGVIERLDILITNDSGLMHIGAGLGTPLVAIFGSTNPVTTGPWSDRAVVVRHELPCSPCLKRTCPEDFECMKAISADEVVSAAESLLERGRTE